MGRGRSEEIPIPPFLSPPPPHRGKISRKCQQQIDLVQNRIILSETSIYLCAHDVHASKKIVRDDLEYIKYIYIVYEREGNLERRSPPPLSLSLVRASSPTRRRRRVTRIGGPTTTGRGGSSDLSALFGSNNDSATRGRSANGKEGEEGGRQEQRKIPPCLPFS